MLVDPALLALIDSHLALYPLMRAQDVYKLLYQGLLGPEHLVANAQAFRTRLLAEYESVVPDAHEPLYEHVRPDGRLLRAKLRPIKAQGGNPDLLLAACLQATAMAWETPGALRAAWGAVTAAHLSDRWPEIEHLTPFSAWLAAHDYPPVHHSGRYREAYRPSYRLVAGPIEAALDAAT